MDKMIYIRGYFFELISGGKCPLWSSVIDEQESLPIVSFLCVMALKNFLIGRALRQIISHFKYHLFHERCESSHGKSLTLGCVESYSSMATHLNFSMKTRIIAQAAHSLIERCNYLSGTEVNLI
jgi:hypothetical protein